MAVVGGIDLTLMVGPMVPLPVSRDVLDALADVEVTVGSGADDQSAFRLSFTLSTRSPLHTLFMVAGGKIPPILRVVIVVTVGGRADVLIDGVVTRSEVTGGKGGRSSLVVSGTDLTTLMDLVDYSGLPFPAMPVAVRVAGLLAKYAVLGVIPKVVPPIITDVPIPIDRIYRQKGTDLAYLRLLAADAGYVFHHAAGPVPGASFAYWGPELRVGVPQPALNVDMDAHTNVSSLTFTYDSDQKAAPIVFIQNEETKAPIPIRIPPDLSPLSPPLSLVPGLPKRFPRLGYTAKLPIPQAVLHGMVRAARSSDTVTGTGALDVLRYGRVLKAHELVGVRGAGPAFDGLHYVRKVTHKLARGQYAQNFELVRDSLVAREPRVRV